MAISLKRFLVFLCLVAIISTATPSFAEQASPQTPPVLLQMIRDDAIHRDLGLSAEQHAKVLGLLREVDGPWFRSRNLPTDQQHRAVSELTAEVETRLAKILDATQLNRIDQLSRQAMGTRMVLRNDVAKSLGLSPTTIDAFRTTFLETDKKVHETQKMIRSGELDAKAGNREVNRVKAREQQSLVKLLSDEQKAKVGSLTGEPFNFADVRRTYPLAPELTSAGAAWIQGGPLTMEQLRGKVIAVHFYAFQCINCQRNLPHYKAWHDDYADKDLVIIGIQTPETSTEEKIDRVSAAATMEGMEYPIIMDAEKSNWSEWNNTMWPTVYLIDKKGFIRRWWQGEMNWQGTPGEQQMRQTIEQLLSEES